MTAAAAAAAEMAERRIRYKATRDAGEWRRMREAKADELRRELRLEGLKRRRASGEGGAGAGAGADGEADPVEKLMKSLPTLVEKVYSDDNTLQLEGTAQFVRLLAIERSPPIDEVVASGVVPRFVGFLSREDLPGLQYEAAWALTNVASGTSEHTKVVVDHGAVPIFVKLLGLLHDDVREQAVWALGNIAGDCSEHRDLVLANGALIPMLLQLNAHSRLSMLRSTTWTLSSFCRGRPPPAFEQVKFALPALERLIHSNDEEVLTDACRALSYLSDSSNDKIQAVIEAGVCPRLVELLLHPSPTVLIPALRTIGNIVSGDDMQTQHVINHQVLPKLLNILTNNHKKTIMKEACWIVSNITAGNGDQIQAVIDSGIIVPLVHLLHSAELVIKKEAAWAISNAISGGTNGQIKYLVSQGCVKPLCDLLASPDPSVVKLSLGVLDNILKSGEAEKNPDQTRGKNPYRGVIYQAEGVEKLENLQSHNNAEVHEKAVKILEMYFPEEHGEDMVSDD